jgi:pilus assembly protein CpaB
MERRRRIMLGLSLGIAAWMLADLLLPMTGLVSAGAPSSPLVGIAARSMPAGYRMDASDLEPVEVKDDGNGGDASSAKASMPAAVGRVLAKSVSAGEKIRATDLVPRTAGERIARQLPKGYRAISVSLRDGLPTVALYPGATVDVLSTIDVPPSNGSQREAVTRTVVERARVLAVNDEAVGTKPDPNLPADRRALRRTTVTLAVTPEQAAQLEFASAKGSIGVTLRAEDDDTPSSSAMATARKSAPQQPEPAPKPVVVAPQPATAKAPEKAPEKPWEVTLMRGGDSEKVAFPDSR